MAKLEKNPWLSEFPWGPWTISSIVEAADQVPEKLAHRGMALVVDHGKAKWLVFDCPCRRGHRIMLTLDSSFRNYWRVGSHGGVSVWPSVDAVHEGRRCHYIIRGGATTWVPERGR